MSTTKSIIEIANPLCRNSETNNQKKYTVKQNDFVLLIISIKRNSNLIIIGRYELVFLYMFNLNSKYECDCNTVFQIVERTEIVVKKVISIYQVSISYNTE